MAEVLGSQQQRRPGSNSLPLSRGNFDFFFFLFTISCAYLFFFFIPALQKGEQTGRVAARPVAPLFRLRLHGG